MENQEDYMVDFALTADQEKTLRESFNAIMAGGGYGNIRLEFRDHKLMYIKCETINKVGSANYTEY